MVNVGIDILLLLGLYLVADRARLAAVFRPLSPLGRNPLVAYVGAAVLAAALAATPGPGTASYWWHAGAWFVGSFGALGGTLLFSAAYVCLWWVIVAIMEIAGVRLRL